EGAQRPLSGHQREAIQAAMECRHLVRVRSMCLHTVNLTGGGMGLLASSPHLTNLEDLMVSGASSGDVEMEALAASPILRRLTALRLGDDFGPDGLAAVVRSNFLGPLRSLVLTSNRGIGPGAGAVLARSPRLRGLSILGLNSVD